MDLTRGLVIIHLDALGYRYLQQALGQGRMPFVQHLIDREGYEPLRWRCGLPSTTPYVQAGLIFGDNRQIPSFRWWDKEANRLIVFGGLSTFKHVSDKYFAGTKPLLANGAAIATCYTGEAVETYRLAYRYRGRLRGGTMPTQHNSLPYSIQHIAASWFMNPLHVMDLTRSALVQIWKTNVRYWKARRRGRRTADKYLITNMLEEIFLHQMTRHATIQAMRENYPIIYAAFYSYDGIAHALGPGSEDSAHSLRHMDRTIQRIAAQRDRQTRHYEILVLSDHGQTESVPYVEAYDRSLGQDLSAWLPGSAIQEFNGKEFAPAQTPDGRIVLTYSGGLAHLYFIDQPGRLDYTALEAKFPGLLARVTGAPGIGFVMVRGGSSDLIFTPEGRMELTTSTRLSDNLRDFLARFDDPDIVARQLHKLNSFERSGDLVIFSAYSAGRQVNFENQIGGHGSLGGEQNFPFLLAKRQWGIDTNTVADACDLHPQLKRLRDCLQGAPREAPSLARHPLVTAV